MSICPDLSHSYYTSTRGCFTTPPPFNIALIF
nr:MAG TPA: hypothetical protein [Caudoviricetes sp.]DAV16382.1 MAG TPA: hypothetical protein [Caudoviricetes sp.]